MLLMDKVTAATLTHMPTESYDNTHTHTHTHTHTIVFRSTEYTSLVLPDELLPAKRSAEEEPTKVKEKATQGGGLSPVTLGDSHSPEQHQRDKLKSQQFTRVHSMVVCF